MKSAKNELVYTCKRPEFSVASFKSFAFSCLYISQGIKLKSVWINRENQCPNKFGSTKPGHITKFEYSVIQCKGKKFEFRI